MNTRAFRRSIPAAGAVSWQHTLAGLRGRSFARWWSKFLLLLLALVPLTVLGTITSVSIDTPTSNSVVTLDAGSGLPVTISYTADAPASSTIGLTLSLLSGSTVVGSTNLTVSESIPSGSTSLTFHLTNCTLSGALTLQVQAVAGATLSATQANAVVVTSGKPYPFTVTGGGPYCPGSSGSPIGLSGSEEGVNYQLKKGTSNSGLPVAGTGGAISFGNKVFVGTYTVVAINVTSGCSNAMSGSVQVSVGTGSVGGTAAADESSICSGSTATIHLSGQTGSIVEWQYTVDDGETWNSIASTSNPLVTSALTTTTYFQAVVKNGDCTEALSSVALVSVDPATVAGSAAPASASICSGSSTTITLSGYTGTILKWQYSPDGNSWTDIPSTASSLNTGNLTASRRFRAVVKSGGCAQLTSSEAVVTVNAATVGGSASAVNSTVCSGSSTTINLSGNTGSIVAWQYSTDGVTWLGAGSTANSLTTANLTVTTQFRALVQNGSCAVVDSSATTVTVDPASVGGSAVASSATLCSGSSTVITLSGQTGSIVKWQYSPDGSSWTDIPTTANPLNTGNLNATRRFRAVVRSGSCDPIESSEAVVTVSPATVAGTTSTGSPTVCSGGSASITLSGQTGSIVKWQSSSDGISWSDIASTSNPLVVANLTATTLFRAMVQSGDCSVLDSASTTVTVQPASVGGSATPGATPLCSGSATSIALSGQTGSIVKWQWSPDGSTWSDILSTANPLYTGALTATRRFRAVVQSGDCTPANSSEAIVAVNAPPAISSHPSSAIKLPGDSVTFSVSASGATGYQWRKGGVNIGGATASSYTINTVSVGSAGSYDCVVSGDSPCANTTSHAAELTVASALAFKSEPVTTVAGVTLPAVVVQIQDENGNDVAVSGESVSLTLNGSASLGGTLSATTDANGAATFSDLVIVKAGTGYTLTADSGSLTAANSASFAILPAAASAYRLAAASTTVTPSVADALTIRLVDQYSNTVTSFNGDKNLTFSGLSTAANGTHPTVANKSGTAINLGSATTITFTNGQNSAGGALLAYKAEGPVNLAATDGTLSTASVGGTGVALTIPNVAPTASPVTVYRAKNTQLRLLASSLLAADTDANGDNLTFVSASTPSANGAAVAANSTFVLYSIAAGNNPSSDTFSYTISDGVTTSSGTVTVNLTPDTNGTNYNVVSYGTDGGGHPSITFAGIPGLPYKVQRTQALGASPIWTDVLTTNVPSGGLFQFVDPEIVNPAFYRAISQ